MTTGRAREIIRDLLRDLEEFERTPESAGYDLRLDLADIVMRQLRAIGWTQQQLADAAGMKASFITRVIHAAQNCTFEVAGRILFALGVKAELVGANSGFLGMEATSHAEYIKEPIFRWNNDAVELSRYDSAWPAADFLPGPGEAAQPGAALVVGRCA